MQPINTLERVHGLGLIEHDEELSKTTLTAEKVYAAVLDRQLPPKLDLRLDYFPVRDQGSQGSCVAFATMTIAQNLEHHDTTQLREPLAPQYLYNLRSNYPDEGMYISDAMKLMQSNGVVLERQFPYGNEGDKNSIPDEVRSLGQKYKMGEFAWIETLDGLKKSMNTRNAGILLTFKVYNYTKHFWRMREGDNYQGNHAVAAVGYDDNKERIIIQNSWGKDWGQNGYTFMTYEEFRDHAHQQAVAFVDVKGSEPFNDSIESQEKRCPVSCTMI